MFSNSGKKNYFLKYMFPESHLTRTSRCMHFINVSSVKHACCVQFQKTDSGEEQPANMDNTKGETCN